MLLASLSRSAGEGRSTVRGDGRHSVASGLTERAEPLRVWMPPWNASGIRSSSGCAGAVVCPACLVRLSFAAGLYCCERNHYQHVRLAHHHPGQPGPVSRSLARGPAYHGRRATISFFARRHVGARLIPSFGDTSVNRFVFCNRISVPLQSVGLRERFTFYDLTFREFQALMLARGAVLAGASCRCHPPAPAVASSAWR